MLNRVQIRNKECQIYTELVRKLLGKGHELFLSIVFWFYIYGSLISYHLTASDFFMNTFGQMLGSLLVGITPAKYNDDKDNNIVWFKKLLRAAELLFGCLLLYPFALSKIANNILRMLYF